ncbi:28S ribosomal protein S5, mitochondrial [Contarinia nasturtii]|uniref:28S ribosomal protein S5, mitochondrial n=1 Tax=Contarinia nasturtii TaxID=265458 RepID=UPI0012D49370|nr:28S ribosomal protein S5, mitochondrial [Contarinia nasturtii]
MALRLLCGTARNWTNYAISGGLSRQPAYRNTFTHFLNYQSTPIADSVRSVSFLNKITGADLWKTCTTVSNAGKKRGRARLVGKGRTKDLNRGQIIGQGRKNVVLPGLNTMVKRGNEILTAERGVDDPSWTEKLYNVRDSNRSRRKTHINPMERGYSGTKLAGRSIGPPDWPTNTFTFDGFDSRALENKIVVHMTKRFGRHRTHSVFVATGNGQGVCGISLGKASDPKSAIRVGKTRASKKLMHFHLCDNRTVYHDFFAQFGYTKIYGYKMPEGYGLRQNHRVIKTLCQLIGIKDLRTKVEGAKHPQTITKAFLLGLLQQKTYQQLAEEKKLFVVEFDPRRQYFPQIVGKPLSYCRKLNEIPAEENRDFKQYVLNGKVIKKQEPRKNPWQNLPSYERYLKKHEKRRSWPAIKFYLRVRYGKLRSFLTDKYPEATNIDQDEY